MSIARGVAICHYNRIKSLLEIMEAVQKTKPKNCKIIVCDDGSDSLPPSKWFDSVVLIRGENKGVAANKNRALFALQDCQYITILEDDLIPTEEGWFEIYEQAARLSEIHHFCRVQDKLVEETIPEFNKFMRANSFSPIYGSSPRGDLTFITSEVLRLVGGFNPRFKGAGYAHGEWSNRVVAAGLIQHPLKWVDIREARDKFKQVGDTEGGRWDRPRDEIKDQLKANAIMLAKLKKKPYIYHPLMLE